MDWTFVLCPRCGSNIVVELDEDGCPDTAGCGEACELTNEELAGVLLEGGRAIDEDDGYGGSYR